MCGFLVRSNNHAPADHTSFSRALQKISYRGPDSSSIICTQDGCLFGHNRLSIVDLSSGSTQPITRDNNVLVFNGEIYNYQQLAHYLSSTYLVDFETCGDSEVLLMGLILEKEEFISKVDGMFAFCFYDKHGTFYLGRDTYGQKPLFYSFLDDELTVCSELGPVLHLISSQLSTNTTAFSDYLLFGASIAPSTLYQDIFSLLPGHILKIENSSSSTPKRFLIPIKPIQNSKDFFESYYKSFDSLISASDQPIALLCSGGIDSSFICLSALRRRVTNIDLSMLHLRTYSDPIGTKISQRISQLTSIPLVIADFDQSILHEGLESLARSIISRFSEPFADTSYFTSKLLYRSTPKGVKVLVGGDGADEVFSGYKPSILFAIMYINSLFLTRNVRKAMAASFFKGVSIRNTYARALLGEKSAIETIIYGVSRNQIAHFLSDCNIDHTKMKILRGPRAILDYYYNYLYLRLSNVFLRKSDHSSMECSKELRSPFLSPTLYKLRPYSILSLLLRKAFLSFRMLRYLRPYELFRHKVGFDVVLPYSQAEIIKQISLILQSDPVTAEAISLSGPKLSLLYQTSHRFTWRLYLLLKWLQTIDS